MMEGKDRLLMKELLLNSRQKIIDLAKKCGLARQSVYRKLEELEKRGVRFTLDLDPRELGLKMRAYILIEAETYKVFRMETDKIIKSFKEISQIHYILGRFDILVEVVVRDIDELSDILEKVQKLPAVKKTETLVVHGTTKLNHIDPLLRELEKG